MGSTNTILASIDALTAEIKDKRAAIESMTAEVTRLETAREALGSLVSVDEAKPVRKAQRAKMTPSEAGEKLVESVVKQAREQATRTQTHPNGGTARKARNARAESRATKRGAKTTSKRNGKATTNGHKPQRRDQIIALLDEGMTPREIGNELGIAPNYVYHVKRNLAAA